MLMGYTALSWARAGFLGALNYPTHTTFCRAGQQEKCSQFGQWVQKADRCRFPAVWTTGYDGSGV